MTKHPARPTVYVVEDDDAIQDVITLLVESVNLQVKTFKNPQEFLKAINATFEGCILLDVRMPEMSGLDLYEELKKRHCTLPIIFMSGYPDISVAVRAMKAGAIDFIVKPFDNQLLLEKIQRAISLSSVTLKKMQFLKRLESLTPREKEIVKHVVEGKTNKEIARELNICSSTVELHRSNLMAKMRVKNSAELIKSYWKKVSL